MALGEYFAVLILKVVGTVVWQSWHLIYENLVILIQGTSHRTPNPALMLKS
jgi:hypothetical protein